MKKQELYERVMAYMKEAIPVAETELHYKNPYELLVAVILSAQCTDKRVNQITPALFEAYPTPEVLAETTPEAVFEYVRSVSYPNNKAKHLVGMARMLVKDFNGRVPDTLDELTKLPGVGRKTAIVFQDVVFRVSHRIGLVGARCTTPLSVEKELTKHIPPEVIPTAHHWLILHGRYTCTARNPKCEPCGLKLLCKHYKTTHKLRPAQQLEDSSRS